MRQFTGGLAEVELEAATFKDILDQLQMAYPGLAPQIRRGVSMSLNGVIYREAWLQRVDPGAEVVIMPFMQGG